MSESQKPVECEWRVFHSERDTWEIIKEFRDEEGRKCTRFIGPMHREDAETIVRALKHAADYALLKPSVDVEEYYEDAE
jgi:hypothetical protein